MSEETATTPETSETPEGEETSPEIAETETVTSSETTEPEPKPKPKAKRAIPIIDELLYNENGDVARAYAQMMFKCAIRAGKSEDEARTLAVAVSAAFDAAEEARVELDSKGEPIEPHLLIVACTPRGSFWRAGRQFTRVSQKLYLKDLNEDEIALLKSTNPQALNVIQVGG